MEAKDIVDSFIGLDKTQQIFDLWLELYFQKALFTELLKIIPHGETIVKDQMIINARVTALHNLNARFPNMSLTLRNDLTGDHTCKLPDPE